MFAEQLNSSISKDDSSNKNSRKQRPTTEDETRFSWKPFVPFMAQFVPSSVYEAGSVTK
jgi:hypothetical protein